MKKLVNRKTISIIVLFILIGVFTHEFLRSNATVSVDINVLSEETGRCQLYFYSGDDIAPFDEMHQVTADVHGSKTEQTLQFKLPLARLQNVRLDIDGVSSLLIRGLSISCLGEHIQVSLGNVEASSCQFSLMEDGYQFQKTDDDAQLYLGDLRFPIPGIMTISILIATLAIIVAIAALWLLRGKDLQGKFYRYRFLFEELVTRDFKKKYKRTVLGMLWSMLNPLLVLLVMWMVFKNFFGQTMNHYVIYLFAGNIVFAFFNEATSTGMNSLVANAGIFTKVNVPKYMFLFSQSITALINFGLTLLIFFAFVAIEGLLFTPSFVCLLFPIVCLVMFNIGVGMILSALFVFFRDVEYLWNVFTMLLMYLSAIFYTIDGYSQTVQNLFLLNPVYLYIRYFRKIVLEGIVPSAGFHLLALAYALLTMGIGCWVYKKYNTRFLYYV